MNDLLHAAQTAPRGQRWHPRIVLTQAHQNLVDIRLKHASAWTAATSQYLNLAETALKGASMAEAKVAVANLFYGAADCHARHADLAAASLRDLADKLTECVIHLGDRRRHERTHSSAGFCTYCWRVTDNYRGDRYLCELHRGGSRSPIVKAAVRCFKKNGRSITNTELDVLTAMGLAPWGCDGSKRTRAQGALPAHPGDEPPRLPDTLAHSLKDVGPWESAQKRVNDTGVMIAGAWSTHTPRAYALAGTNIPGQAALILARGDTGSNHNVSDVLQVALDRIALDQYYAARVLARAEAFLRHPSAPKGRPAKSAIPGYTTPRTRAKGQKLADFERSVTQHEEL